MGIILKLLKEPSTWAGLTILASLFGVPAPVAHAVATAGQAVFASPDVASGAIQGVAAVGAGILTIVPDSKLAQIWRAIVTPSAAAVASSAAAPSSASVAAAAPALPGSNPYQAG